MVNLENVTLIALTSLNVEQHVKALEYSCKGVEFGAVKLASPTKPGNLTDSITWEKIDRTLNIDEWSYAAIYELPKHVDTEFCILIHDDGFIVNPDSWRNEFLNYDYIGAPFPLPTDDFSYRDANGKIFRVGNSVSIRSKKLLDLPIKLNLEWKPFHGYYNEDGFICAQYRHIYEEYGCKFADIEVAKYFSHETPIPEIQGIKPFAFHRYSGSNNIYPNFSK